ncbi:hypothetical protein H0W91_02720 [Patescibacteria group bacterium]|nr:hypothetical protein [Patescibacteria group bacterium]
MSNDTIAKNEIASQRNALVPTNPSVMKLAKRLRWSPERAIIRIQRALPALFEQQIYLELASDFGILPESMAKLLRFYMGEEELDLEDLEFRQAGNNLVTSKFVDFAEFLRECLNLLKIVAKEFTSFSLTVNHAAMIVYHYGTDQPELLIEMVDGNLEELCEVLGVNNEHPYSQRMRLCIWLMVTKVIPENRSEGRPDFLDISDILSISSARRRALRRELLEDLPDYLSADSDELRHHPSLETLKKEGII